MALVRGAPPKQTCRDVAHPMHGQRPPTSAVHGGGRVEGGRPTWLRGTRASQPQQQPKRRRPRPPARAWSWRPSSWWPPWPTCRWRRPTSPCRASGFIFDASQTQLNLVRGLATPWGSPSPSCGSAPWATATGASRCCSSASSSRYPRASSWRGPRASGSSSGLASSAAWRRAWPTRRRSRSSPRSWSGPGRARCIALWSATGGAIAALGPLVAGLPPLEVLVGLRLPHLHPVDRRGLPAGLQARPEPRQRDR